jgi:hypothetical protein
LCSESIGILGDRFLIEIGCDRNFDVVGLLSAIAVIKPPCFLCDNLGIENLIKQIRSL